MRGGRGSGFTRRGGFARRDLRVLLRGSTPRDTLRGRRTASISGQDSRGGGRGRWSSSRSRRAGRWAVIRGEEFLKPFRQQRAHCGLPAGLLSMVLGRRSGLGLRPRTRRSLHGYAWHVSLRWWCWRKITLVPRRFRVRYVGRRGGVERGRWCRACFSLCSRRSHLSQMCALKGGPRGYATPTSTTNPPRFSLMCP